jgi:hypothetical protein
MAFNLTELFKSLHASVEEATDVSRCAANRWIEQFFTVDEDGKYTPKYVTMVMPVMVGGKMVENEIRIPMYTLANHQSLKIDELEIDFCVNLEDLQDKETIAHSFGLFKKQSDNRAKIRISFKSGEPAEGIMKINDSLVKTIP